MARRWGPGPEVGDPYEDVRYPVESVDQLVASFPCIRQHQRRWRRSRFASPQETAALEALFNRIGPSVLLVHSAGGGSGFAVAQTVPDLVERIVAVGDRSVRRLTRQPWRRWGGDAPFMGVYGDYVDEREQTGRKARRPRQLQSSQERQVPHRRCFSLPDEGISGNTHLMMQDDNNGEIADRILTRIGD